MTVSPPPNRDPQGSPSWQFWFESVYQALRAPLSGTTANRPTQGLYVGTFYYDTTLNKPIWWNGSDWKDATGATV